MKTFVCQKCGASIPWDEQSEFMFCPRCGQKYRPRVVTKSPRQPDGVREIPTTEGRYAGQALVRGFVPEGWRTVTNAPEQESNILSPLPMQVSYTSPGEDAFITFTGTRIFTHIDNTPQNAPRQGQMILPERMVGWSYQDAEYLYEVLLTENPLISDVRLLNRMDQPDPWAQDHMRRMMQAAANGGTINPGGNWVKKYATCRDKQGNLWHKLVEVMVIYCFLPIPQAEQMMYQMALQSQQRTMALANMYAARFGGLPVQQVQPPRPKLRWAVQYIVETSAREEIFREAAAYHDKIRATVEFTELHKREASRVQDALHQLAQRDSQMINDALGEMNRQQSQSWDRRRKIIQETNDYTTNLMRETQKNTSDTMHRVNNRWSEVIRGVNTYYTKNPGYGEPRVVEVSNQFDHVYQSNQHPGRFVATDDPWGPGADYDELEKTNGDY